MPKRVKIPAPIHIGMQEEAYQTRDARILLLKAPPALGKSQALMFIALDKLMHQGNIDPEAKSTTAKSRPSTPTTRWNDAWPKC